MPIDEGILRRAAALVQDRTGLHSPESHHSHLQRILQKMSRTTGKAPEALITDIPRDSGLYRRFINQAMIGETYFFREESHFQVLVQEILPELLKKRGKLTLWSASCSTGEEAVSLAAAARYAVQTSCPGAELKVYATDINTDSLEYLQRGRYPRKAFRGDGASFHSLILNSARETPQGDEVVLLPELLELIQPRAVNLFKDSLEFLPEDLDVIFFRNTLIYAPEESRRTMIDQVTAHLQPEGVFFSATSEAPFIQHPRLRLEEQQGVHFFRHRPAGPPEPPEAPARPSAPLSSAPSSSAPSASAPSAVFSTKGTTEEKTNAAPRISPKDYTPLLQQLVSQVNQQDMAGGKKTLALLEDTFGTALPQAFLQGWFRRFLDPPEEALPSLRTAAAEDPDYWPPLYYQAEILLPRSGEEAGRLYREALRRIDQLPPTPRPPSPRQETLENVRQILQDGFDTAYFRRLCRLRLDQLAPLAPQEENNPWQ